MSKQVKNIAEYVECYEKYYTTVTLRIIDSIVSLLILLATLGLLWMIPFPPIFGKYSCYFNWASVMIGIAIYYYYKLSPTISYVMLLIIFGFSWIIICLEKIAKQGGFPIWGICSFVLIICFIWKINNTLRNGKRLIDMGKFTLMGLTWLLQTIFKKLKF